jgi:hypothetical protein
MAARMTRRSIGGKARNGTNSKHGHLPGCRGVGGPARVLGDQLVGGAFGLDSQLLVSATSKTNGPGPAPRRAAGPRMNAARRASSVLRTYPDKMITDHQIR